MEEICEIYLIDKQGNRFSSETISSHIGLAYKIIEENEQLAEKLKQSGKRNPLEFLLVDEGFMSASQIGTYYKQVVYDSETLSEQQKKWAEYYGKRNFEFKDLADEKEEYQR